MEGDRTGDSGERGDDRSAVATALRALARGPALPVPGSGRTGERLDRLAAASRGSLSVGRLLEAHADAQAILTEAGWGEVGALGLLGVWASERDSGVAVTADGTGCRIEGTKRFCSGAPLLEGALVTARSDAGVELVLVRLDDPGVQIEASEWPGPGMRDTETRTVHFDRVAAERVGPTGWYLRRPGFWHGAVGVAASWFGGAEAMVERLAGRVGDDDPHGLAHLGEADARVYGMAAALHRAAAEIDADPCDRLAARRRALRVRRLVAQGCLAVVRHASDALGPRGLAFDAGFAQAAADLEVYVRQEHGRRDAEALGRVLAPEAGP